MILIFEGSDCVGKSTLINNLKKYINNVEVYHFTNPPNNTPEYWEHCIDIIKNNEHKNLIFDRYFYGEVVYPEIYPNRKSQMSFNLFVQLEKYLKSKNAKLFLLTRLDIGDYYKKFIQAKEDKLTFEQAIKAQNLFIDVFKYSQLDKMCINMSKYPDIKDLPKVISDILEFIYF